MRILSFISFLTILNFETLAQDSTFVILEQHKLFNNSLEKHYNSPALKSTFNPTNYTDIGIKFKHSDSDDYIIQKGSGFNALNIDITSFQKKNNTLTLWGKFQYNNINTKKVNFNETLDYDYLYPYITTDTVGGDLSDEHYFIQGGIANEINKTIYALETSFLGKQSTRDRDPRANNISANFNLLLSASRPISSNYLAALTLIGERYFQENTINFNSEMGYPTLYHETGLGNYNNIFAGTRDKAEYLGYNYGVNVNFVPKNKTGWFASLNYLGSNINKKVTGLATPINNSSVTNLGIAIGHKVALSNQSFLESGIQGKHKTINGTEGKFFNQDSQSGLIKITEENLFDYTSNNITAYISYQKSNTTNIWNTTISAGYTDRNEIYQLPARFQDFQFLNISGEVKVNQTIAKNILSAAIKYAYNNPLSAKSAYTGLNSNSRRYQMLENNFNYLNTQLSTIDLSAKLSIPMQKVQNIYFGASAKYISAYKLTQFGLTTGFVF